MKGNVKLVDATLTEEDFEVIYAVYEYNLLGLLVYPRPNCSLNRVFNVSTYIINTIPH